MALTTTTRVHATRLLPGDFIPAGALLYPRGCWEAELDDVRYEYRGGDITYYPANLVEPARARVPVTVHQGEGLRVSGGRREFRCDDGGELVVARGARAALPELRDVYLPAEVLAGASASCVARWRALLPLGTVARLQREGGWVSAEELEAALDGLHLEEHPPYARGPAPALAVAADVSYLTYAWGPDPEPNPPWAIVPTMEHRVRLMLRWLAEQGEGVAQ